MPRLLSRTTREYLSTSFSTQSDPTDLAVKFLLLARGAGPPEDDDEWVDGEWVQPAPDGGPYTAHILVGVLSDVELAPGKYHAWVRVVGSPEAPDRIFDHVQVF